MNTHTYLSTKWSVVGRIALLALLIVALAACVDPNGGNTPNGGDGNGGDNTGGGNGGDNTDGLGLSDEGFDANGIHEDKPVITATPPGDEKQFGWAVAFSGDGTTVLVGEFNGTGGLLASQSGTAIVFTRQDDGTWIEQAELVPTAGDFAMDLAVRDEFGTAVALSHDGNTALIGARKDNLPFADAGSAYVFTRESDGMWSLQQKLTAPLANRAGNASNGNFGRSVALSDDGNTAFIGAPVDDVQYWCGLCIHLGLGQCGYRKQDSLVLLYRMLLDLRLHFSGNTALIGASLQNSRAGAVTVYTGGGATWTQQGIPLTATTGGSPPGFDTRIYWFRKCSCNLW